MAEWKDVAFTPTPSKKASKWDIITGAEEYKEKKCRVDAERGAALRIRFR